MPEYSPTFIKVDPATGLTYYDFDGHIKAAGIDLQSPQPSALVGFANRRIIWTRDNDPVRESGSVSSFYDSTDKDYAVLNAGTFDPYTPGVMGANITARRDPNNPANDGIFVAPSQGQQGAPTGVTLIDGNGSSEFLRRMVGAEGRVRWGSFSVNIAAGASTGSAVVATGETQSTPKFIVTQNVGGSGYSMCQTGVYTPTSFSAFCKLIGSTGVDTQNFHWLGIF